MSGGTDDNLEQMVELLTVISRQLDDISSKLEGGQMMSVWDMLSRINDNLYEGYGGSSSAWDKLDAISDKLSVPWPERLGEVSSKLDNV